MSEYLVLRLHGDQPNRASWVIADNSGQSASMTETGTLADAARRAQQRPVIVLVPGRDVLLTKIELPVRGATKMLQAVPYALEEQLADQVNNMHFALGPRDATGKVMVAAVREPLMQNWLSQLEEAGLEIAYLLPDTAGVPVHDGVSILIDGADCLISDAQNRVLTGDTESAAAFIAALGFDESDTSANLYVSEADATRYAQVLSEIRMALPDTTVTHLRHGALPVMATTALKTPQPNLLQGAHARSSGRERLWRPWLAAAMLAGVFILVALGAKALEVMSLKSELRALNAELNDIAGEVMPGSRIVDPLLQLEQLYSELSGNSQSADTDFLNMLDSLGRAMTAAGSATLDKLDYRNSTMNLTLTAPSVDSLDKISRDIVDSGIAAEIKSAQQDGSVVQGRIKLSRLEP